MATPAAPRWVYPPASAPHSPAAVHQYAVAAGGAQCQVVAGNARGGVVRQDAPLRHRGGQAAAVQVRQAAAALASQVRPGRLCVFEFECVGMCVLNKTQDEGHASVRAVLPRLLSGL